MNRILNRQRDNIISIDDDDDAVCGRIGMTHMCVKRMTRLSVRLNFFRIFHPPPYSLIYFYYLRNLHILK